MPKVIAIDRTERHLRYVLAETGSRSQVSILAADTIDIPADTEAVATAIGEQLHKLLAQQKATQARVLAGLGRGALETVEFTVPAAKEFELPSMVRNLAMRHLSSISEETVLDFLTSPARNDGSSDVVAMTVREDVQQELDRLTAAAQTHASRILVRPHELRAFVAEAEVQSQVVLVVSSSPQVVDVLLVHPEGWLLARSIRVVEGSSSTTSARQVVNEIRRTLFSLPVEDFDSTHIDRVLLLAGPEELQPLATELGTALDAPVQRHNPFSNARIRTKITPNGASQFAPLVGMLLNEAEGSHPVDFLNPRQPPKPVNRVKVFGTAAAGIAALAAGAAFFVNGQFAAIDEENVQLAARRNELKQLAKEIQPKLRLAKALGAWENSRMSWLDELRDLTLRMPARRDLTVNRFSVSPARGGGATVTFSGESRAPEVVSRMEQSLRDEHHRPKTPGLRERPTQDDKPVWSFQTTMVVKPRAADEYAGHGADDGSSSSLAASQPGASVGKPGAQDNAK